MYIEKNKTDQTEMTISNKILLLQTSKKNEIIILKQEE